MLKEELEMDLMPAGCATTFPRRYEKNKITEILDYPETSLGSGGSIQGSWDGSAGFWDEDLNELLKIHPTDEAKAIKRKISASFVPEDGSEASEDKKKKYYDTHAPLYQETRIFRNSQINKFEENRLFNDYIADEDIGDHSTSTPSGKKINLKRKVENTQPKPADDLMDKGISAKKPCKNNHSRKTRKVDTGDEPKCEVQSEKSSVDDLMLELENVHIGPNPENQRKEETPSPNLKRKTVSSQSTTEPYSQSDAIPKIPKLEKLADWTKKHWEEDQRHAMLDGDLNSSVVVCNLPMAISSTYQQCLREVFEEYGQIMYIGPAIKHTTVDGECAFNTTIYFDSETAAVKALQEDHTRFGSSEIRVLRNLYADTGTLDPHETLGGKSGSAQLGIDKGTETSRPGRPSALIETPAPDERKVSCGKPCGACCAQGNNKSTETTNRPSTDAETLGDKSGSTCRANGMVTSVRLQPLLWLRHIDKTEPTRLLSTSTGTETPIDSSVTVDGKSIESRASETVTFCELASAARPGLAWDCQRQR